MQEEHSRPRKGGRGSSLDCYGIFPVVFVVFRLNEKEGRKLSGSHGDGKLQPNLKHFGKHLRGDRARGELGLPEDEAEGQQGDTHEHL